MVASWAMAWPSRAERAGPARLVGVTFDDHEVCGVEVRRERGDAAPEIVRAATTSLAAGVVEGGEILDHEAFAATLRELWAHGCFGTRNAAVGLDGRTTVLRPAELPALEPAELDQAAAYEIGELLSYPLHDSVVSTVEIGRHDIGGVELVRTVTLAAREDALTALRNAVKQAGLRHVTTDLIASSLVAAVDDGDWPADQVDAVVHVSPTITLVLVHDERGLTFSRVITAGVDVSETSLSDELEMELSMLAGYADGATDAPSNPRGPASNPGLTTVVEGIRRTLQYYTTEVDGRPVGRLVLCGPQSGAGGLATAVAETMPEATVLRHRFTSFPAGVDEVSSYDAATSVALAVVAGTGGRRRFDLTPSSIGQRRVDVRRTVAGVAIAALLTPLLIADAADRRGAAADEAAAADAVELSVEALRDELAGFEDDRGLLIDAQRATARVNALREQELAFPTALRRMAESMPEDTFLLSFRAGRSNAAEPPTGYSGEPPPATFSLTGVAGDLDGVGRWIQTVDEVPMVDGLWMTQSAFGPYGATDAVAAVFTVDGALVGPAEPIAFLDDVAQLATTVESEAE